MPGGTTLTAKAGAASGVQVRCQVRAAIASASPASWGRVHRATPPVPNACRSAARRRARKGTGKTEGRGPEKRALKKGNKARKERRKKRQERSGAKKREKAAAGHGKNEKETKKKQIGNEKERKTTREAKRKKKKRKEETKEEA